MPHRCRLVVERVEPAHRAPEEERVLAHEGVEICLCRGVPELVRLPRDADGRAADVVLQPQPAERVAVDLVVKPCDRLVVLDPPAARPLQLAVGDELPQQRALGVGGVRVGPIHVHCRRSE